MTYSPLASICIPGSRQLGLVALQGLDRGNEPQTRA